MIRRLAGNSILSALYILLWGALVCLVPGPLRAADPSASAELSHDLLFRRIFVPADKPESWPVGPDQFLPIDREQFEELVQQYTSKSKTKSQVPPTIRTANYEAELLKEGILSGTADLTLQLPTNEPRLLPLAPMNLAIRSSGWLNNPTQPVELGLWQRPDQVLEFAVHAQKSDTLRLDWRLAASTVDSSRTEFELELPTAVPQTFSLRLPKSNSATITHSELRQIESESTGLNRWIFQLAPRNKHRLRIEQQAIAQKEHFEPYVSQKTIYQLKPAGLEIITQLQFDARETAISELQATITDEMRVVDVHVDQQPVAWRVVEKDGKSTIIIPRPDSQQPQTVEVRNLARFRSNTLWQLPKLQFQKVAWTEGTTQLQISQDLEVRRVTPKDATLQQIAGIEVENQGGEVFNFQEWSPESGIEIIVGRPQPRLAARTATTLEFGRSEAKASMVAVLSSSRGQVYQIEAEVTPGWTVESVTATPASALNEWHIDAEASPQKLQFQLNQPISQYRPLRVEVQARKAAANLEQPATVGQLKLCRFLHTNSKRQLLLLRTQKSRQPVLASRFARARRTADQIADEFGDLIPEPSVGTLLDVSELKETEVVEFRQRVAQYDAELLVSAAALPDTFRQQYQIDFQVHSGSVSRLALEFDEPLPEDIQWRLVGKRGKLDLYRVASASRVLSSKQTAKYSLQLPEAMSTDFQLQASYTRLALPTERCNLVRLPEATDWSGQVQLRGALENFLVIDQGWTPTIQVANPVNRSGLPLLGSYRLGPGPMRRTAATLGLRLERRNSSTSSPRLTAWQAEYHTLQASNGAALHSASYSLENLGSSEIKVQLPSEAELQEAWLNNQQIDPKLIVSEGNAFRFRIDENERWPSLILQFTTRVPPLGRSEVIQPIIPKCSFSIQISRWTLWAPEQYEIDHTAHDYSTRRNHWWKRIFGPLARSRDETIFQPLDGTSWFELWSAPLVAQQTKQTAELLAAQFADQLQENPDEEIGVFLKALTGQLPPTHVVYVDRAALLARGIQASTTGREFMASNLGSRSLGARANPLSSHRLALLVSTSAIVLTSTERVVHWHDQLRPTETPGLFVVSSDDLSESFEKIRYTRSSDFVELGQWVGAPQRQNSLWQRPHSAALADVGRRAQTVEFIGELPRLVVRRAFFQRALWYALLLLSLVFGVWQLAHFPNSMILLGAFAGAACLIVPIRWLTIPQSVFLGFMAAAIIRIALKSEQIRVGRWKQIYKVSQASGAICFFSSLLLMGGLSHAQFEATPSNHNREETQIPRVLVPIDSRGIRQSDDVYVPADLLQELRHTPRILSNDRAELVVLAATYRGSILENSETETTQDSKRFVRPWTLLWKVESYVPNCRFYLPLSRSEGLWDDDAHRLDGLPVELTWQPNGQGCSVTLPATGMHWLQLKVKPIVSAVGSRSKLRLQLPPISGANLELAVDENSESLRVAGAISKTGSQDSTTREYSLGASEAIELSWLSNPTINNTASWARFDQLSWLHVQPDAVYLDVQLSVSGYRSESTELALEISPQLRLVSPPEDSPIAAVLPSVSKSPSRLRLQLRAGLPKDFVIPLQFEFQRVVPVGHIFFPSVSLLDSMPTKNLFAVSVAAGLSYDEQSSNTIRSIAPSEFTTDWKSPLEEPLYAYALGSDDPDWSLRVRPDPRTFTAQQTIRVHCKAKETQVDFEAILDEMSGTWLTHRIQVPESLVIDDITVHDQVDSSVIPVRWTRVSATEATVFLGRRLLDTHTLSLEGHILATPDHQIELPRIRLRDSERSEIHMDIYRAEDVQVRWVNPQMAAREIPVQRVTHVASEIHVGHFSWQSSDRRELSQLRIERNNLEFTDQSVTTVQSEQDGWSARLNSTISVRRGALTRLALLAPENFQKPFVLQPEQVGDIGEVRDIPNGKEITVRLTQPVVAGEEVKVQLKGSLNLPADRRLFIPALNWDEATQSEHFLVLPNLFEEKSIAWRTGGLRPQALLPAKLRSYATNPKANLLYRVEQQPFVAEERTSRSTMLNARIRSVRVSGVLNTAGRLSATAELILQPGRATSCKVRLPDGSQLYQLVIGDQPVRRELLDDGSWKIPLGPPFMPRRIVVSYQVPVERSGNRLRLQAPRILLGDRVLPTLPTWWRIRSTGNLQVNPPVLGERADEIRFAEQNARSIVNVLGDSLSLFPELSVEEVQAWSQAWLVVANQALIELENFDLDDEARVTLAELKKTYEAFFAVVPDSEVAATLPSSRSYPPPVLQHLDVSPIRTEHFLISDEKGQLVLTTSSGLQKSLWQWFAAAALVFGTLAIVLRLRLQPDWHHQLCYWPHGLAFSGGLAWWLLLKPSAVGMFVMVLVLISLTIKQWHVFRQFQRRKPKTKIVLPTS